MPERNTAFHGNRRLCVSELNQVLLRSLVGSVAWTSGGESKPLELDLTAPAPRRLRVYIYNATYPPGGRTLGERKIQLIVPGQARGERGDLDHSGGRTVLLVGYEADVDVFILWDAGTYRNFPYSLNAQVNAETIFSAYAGKLQTQTRSRRKPCSVTETVICCPSERLQEAIDLRLELSLARLLGDQP